MEKSRLSSYSALHNTLTLECSCEYESSNVIASHTTLYYLLAGMYDYYGCANLCIKTTNKTSRLNNVK